ncbi:NADP-dependent oxidoreductase domain-containing protein [Thelephora terrestris]|uniref:NADP-dependent oxidoreductase domain-containing protein n=1 Tax=Thelephora terrestris TaxID=56493 RepID=A0A9P6LBW0_9AGAM|nr:NADP-dependent oxidoreductase domain-containing protein [Thelephora terrestris]
MTDHQQEIETFELGPLTCPRIFTGLWQLSSVAWGSAPAAKVRRAIAGHAENGYTAFADHYGSAEIMFGRAVKDVVSPIKIVGATKWCVFRPTEVTRPIVEEAVRERMDRMQSDCVDLLQFHWNDYSDHGYIVALQLLQDLQREGLITALGLCNFDAIRMDEICTTLGPDSIVSNQVQFSLIDTRPLHGMTDVCQKHNAKLLTYGTLCGGFLSDSWLGEPEPQLYDGSLTPSQRKYLDMILKAWGDWSLFQELLSVLRSIGDRHGGVSIANVATRWVLDQPGVGAVIIGVRMGIAEHKDDNKKTFGFALTAQDNAAIQAVLENSNGDRLIATIGDCGAEYR